MSVLNIVVKDKSADLKEQETGMFNVNTELNCCRPEPFQPAMQVHCS